MARLAQRSRRFLELAHERGLDTGASRDTPVVPVMIRNSVRAIRLSQRLMQHHGIEVTPMVHPSVPEDGARLRFFINCSHTEEQLRRTADAVATELARARAEEEEYAAAQA